MHAAFAANVSEQLRVPAIAVLAPCSKVLCVCRSKLLRPPVAPVFELKQSRRTVASDVPEWPVIENGHLGTSVLRVEGESRRNADDSGADYGYLLLC